MKLRQKEHCHNCNQDVIYKFEDTTSRQVIICPNCGHQHYREIDEGTLLNIRVNPQCRVIRIAKPVPLTEWIKDPSNPIVMMPKEEIYDERKILGNTENGTIVSSKKDDKNKSKVVTNRRWGRDPRQV